MKKIKITFEYNKAMFTQLFEPYRKFSYVKQIAKNYFYLLKDDTRLFYQNKDITNCNTMLLNELFHNNDKAYLKLFSINSYIHSKSINNNNNKILLKSNSFVNVNRSLQYKPLLKLSNNNFPITKHNIKCKCNSKYPYTAQFYCRYCNEFICKKCRNAPTHFNHSAIEINLYDLNKSAQLYALTLQSELVMNNRTIKNNYNKYQQETFVNINQQHESFLHKLQMIINIYKEMSDVITLSNEKLCNINKAVYNYETNLKTTNSDIENILVDIYNMKKLQGKEMSVDEFKNIYERINSKEKEMFELNCDAISYSVGYEIETKIKEMYKKLNAIVDDVLNCRIQLGLNTKTYEDYCIIKELKVNLYESVASVAESNNVVEVHDEEEKEYVDKGIQHEEDNDDNVIEANNCNDNEEIVSNDRNDMCEEKEDENVKLLPPIKDKSKQGPLKEKEFVDKVIEVTKNENNNVIDLVTFEDIINSNNKNENNVYLNILNEKYKCVYNINNDDMNISNENEEDNYNNNDDIDFNNNDNNTNENVFNYRYDDNNNSNYFLEE